jgi:hypothetical protein
MTAGHDRDDPARLRHANFPFGNRAMPASYCRLSRRLSLWSCRIGEHWHEVELAAAGGEHGYSWCGDFAWHSDGGPAEWVGPVPIVAACKPE